MSLRKIVLLAALFATPAFAADNFQVKDAAGTTITKASKDLGGIQSDKNVIIKSTGAEVDFGTAANQIAIQANAGSNATKAVSIQGIDTGKPIAVTQSGAWSFGGLAQGSTTTGQTGSLILCSTQLAATATSDATSNPFSCTIDGRLRVSVTGTDGGGTSRALATSSTGVLDSPRAGTSNRVVTKVNMSSNTNTQICPAQANGVATEIFFSTAGVGISLAGGTLTQATVGTTASTQPDLEFNTAGTVYTMPVPPTNAITAYGAAGIIVCIQTLRQ